MSNKIKVHYKDGILDETVISFTWLNRLRILFGGRVIVTTEVLWENRAGRIASGTKTEVEKIFNYAGKEEIVNGEN